MISRELEALGLGQQEAKVYSSLLNSRNLSAVKISKITGIKRTTAYNVARSLVEKGLLVENAGSRPCTFDIASPSDIEQTINVERKRFKSREKALETILERHSRPSIAQKYSIPTVRFIEEDKMEKFLYKQTFPWWDSMLTTDTTWWGFQDHTFVDHFEKWIAWQWRQVPNAIRVEILTNRSETEQKIVGKFSRREVKFWENSAEFLSTTWAVGEYVVHINTRDHPFFLVEIHDARLANDQRALFKNLWPLV